MIRTLIEVTADDDWTHKRELQETLKQLGFEPKESADTVRFRSDLWAALQEKGIVPHELVEAYRISKGIGTS